MRNLPTNLHDLTDDHVTAMATELATAVMENRRPVDHVHETMQVILRSFDDTARELYDKIHTQRQAALERMLRKKLTNAPEEYSAEQLIRNKYFQNDQTKNNTSLIIEALQGLATGQDAVAVQAQALVKQVADFQQKISTRLRGLKNLSKEKRENAAAPENVEILYQALLPDIPAIIGKLSEYPIAEATPRRAMHALNILISAQAFGVAGAQEQLAAFRAALKEDMEIQDLLAQTSKEAIPASTRVRIARLLKSDIEEEALDSSRYGKYASARQWEQDYLAQKTEKEASEKTRN